MSECSCRGLGCKLCGGPATIQSKAQTFWLDIEPMGAVRMTRRGKFKDDAAQRYLSYKQAIGWQIKAQAEKEPITGPVAVRMVFFMPIPPSWSKKKQAAAPGQYHTSKPDVDNIAKGCMDGANGLLWRDDSQVVDLQVVKVYGEQVGIELEITEL